MPLTKMMCGVNYTTSLLKDNVNELIDTKSSALGQLIGKLRANTGDTCLFVTSDSTGNGSNEWVYLYSQYLAAEYPVYTVNYYLFNTTTGDYNGATVIQTGTGANTLSIYNAAISGSKPDYITGFRFANAVKLIPNADAVIMNHGHNCVSSYPDTSPSERRAPQLIEAALQILQVHSGAGFVFLTQNPRRDDDNYAPVYNAILRAASLINADVADSYIEFVRLNKAANLYTDSVHPSDAGTQLYLNAVKNLSTASSGFSAKSSFDEYTGFNLLENGAFIAFTAANPDSWSLSSATSDKNLTDFDGLNGYSVKVESTSTGGSLSQTLSTEKLEFVKNKTLTLAVRVFAPIGSASSAGRVALLTSSKSANTSTLSAEGKGGWMWKVLSVDVLESDTYVKVSLYGDTAGNNGFALYDRVILTTGALPLDCML